METIGGVLFLVSAGVFIWACIGLINPQWARLPNRVSSVGVWVLSVVIAGAAGALLPDDEVAPEATQELAQQATAPPPAQQTAPEPPPQPAAQLELLDYTGTTGEYGYSTVEGQVKNISGSSMENVMAVVSWYTADDTFVTSDETLIAYNPILSDQVSPFEVLTQTNPAMTRFRVEFKTLFGGTIRTRRAE